MLELLAGGQRKTIKELMLVAGLRSRNAADGLLHKLVKDGLVVRIRRGCYVKDFPRETILLMISPSSPRRRAPSGSDRLRPPPR